MPKAYDWFLVCDCWRTQIRPAALARASFRCQMCGKRRATEVHHLSYKRIGNEPPQDLLAVCHPCHCELHGLRPANDNQILLPLDETG